MKKRLDAFVCELNPELSRSQAQSLIMSGVVYVNNQKETKSGSMFKEDAVVEIRENKIKYVSRGGLKLEKAMSIFPIDLTDYVCMDIGSSTGGFTDCMLQNGARKVYAVDVGTNQLHYKLRTDDRVIVMEKTNIRHVTKEMIPEDIDFASVDVSFISLTLVIPVAKELLGEKKQLVMLIKPQFEAGREKVGKKGVVRDPEVHREVIKKVVNFVNDQGLFPAGLTYSPVKGPEGNIEYLIYVTSISEAENINAEIINETMIDEVVKLAHEELDK